MFSLCKPAPSAILPFLARQANLNLTYAAIGATSTKPPAGYVVDHNRFQLGRGEKVFAAAKASLLGWRQFDLGWLQAWPPETPIRQGETVAVLARAMGLWWLNACRIVYVVDEVGPVVKFGFAYGTLPDHAGSGEERFLVEWDRSDDAVWYDILAFSRPHQFLARLGYPLVRRTQKRFGRDSGAAMQSAVSAAVSQRE